MKTPPVSAISADAVGARTSAPVAVAQRRRIRSADLFGGGREVLIEHAGETYSLRQTSKGKLILTK